MTQPEAQPERPKVYIRICRVKGCPEEGVEMRSTVPWPDTRHPDSHYSKHHAAPEDMWPRSYVDGYLRPKVLT